MTFRTGLLQAADIIRGIPGALDLRKHTVTVCVRTWTGIVAGEGSSADDNTNLMVGSHNPRVQQVSSKDIVASGGLLTEQDVKVGPLTPQFGAIGIAESAINPETDPFELGSPREILFLVTGPGMPDGGRWFRRINDSALPNFTRMLYLRANADQP